MTKLPLVYGDLGFVHQWDLVAGFPECLLDGIAPGDPAATAALQKSVGVQILLDLVEQLEAAQIMIAAGAPADDAPAETIEAYQAAAAIVASARPATLAHALWRKPRPDETDPAQADALAAWSRAGENVLAALAALAGQSLANDPRPVPASVAMWKAKAVLTEQGLLAAANAAVAAANNPTLSAFWESATEIDRASPTLQKIACALNLTDAQVDGLFREAAALAL